MTTNYKKFLQAAKNYQTIPIYKRFFLDIMTPIQIFQKLKERASFLLESKDSESPWSRYSFIGLDPFLVLKEEHEEGFIARSKTGEIVTQHKHFREALNETIKQLNPQPMDIKLPFSGGAIGYISYDGISEFEQSIQPHANNDLSVSRFYFSFCELILAFDHVQNELIIIHYSSVSPDDSEEQLHVKYSEATAKINQIAEILLQEETPAPLFQMPHQTGTVNLNHVRSNIEKTDFLAAVEKVKAYINNGEVLQTVISQRFELDLSVSGLDIYRVLRIINPSPYMFYMKVDDFEIVGSSPEKLVQINGKHVEIHPIAGTRPRGKTVEEDEQLAEELLKDKKELAEHHMLVELAKHDLMRVAPLESISVPTYMEIGRFSHVMHIISKVTGELSHDASPIDALIAAFPAGTLSGAPKLRAMEIINEIEPTARNLYGGAIGYIGFDGNIDSCITIRSVYIRNQTAYIQAGAGIVADSDPETEWEETINKAKALIKAIEIAENLFSKGEANYV